MQILDRDIDEHPPYCGTLWRHCPEREACVGNYNDSCECERELAFPESKVLDVKSFEEIDLTKATSRYRLIIDHGSLRFVTIPRTDRQLLIAYEREFARNERTHIAGNYLTTLGQMLTARGYQTDIHEVRKRLW